MKPRNPTLICIPVCVQTGLELERALSRAAAEGDMVELRLDCLLPSEFEQLSPRLPELIKTIGRRTIVTLRPSEQGGHRELDAEARRLFWKSNASSGADYRDIEYDLACDADLFESVRSEDWSRAICSYHDFSGVPEDLDHLYEAMASSRARIIKIAVHANDITDCIAIFRLLERARHGGREIIAIAMGESGVATRILGPSRGSFLTYGSVAEGAGTAAGQVSARELRQTYRIDKITDRTAIVGLVGLPTGHSISPHVHNAAFEATGVDAVYLRFEVHDLEGFMRRMVDNRSREFDWNLRGLSVTAPHKSAVLDYLDWVEPAAKDIGAVNTVVVDRKEIQGYNTDAEGFIKPLLRRLGSLTGLRCAVIGAGGAARTAAWVLRREGARVTVFARQIAKANLLAHEFGVEADQLGNAGLGDFDLVINATALGTSGALENETVVTARQLSGAGFFYDLVYNPKETRLMREARDAGCQTLGGAEMLITQAAAQFRLWTGNEAPLEVMAEAAEKALQG